jgi:CheY-like chemotaxis protein
MTAGKRALIVDDSRSARVILSRMLEQHGMAVDTAESAEQALEYLQQTRPDVIFMDHLMPGMDGFQAVQAIKGDAQTATIPLMMYTSQEGELYVSQARPWGHRVLPKTSARWTSRVSTSCTSCPTAADRSALFDARAGRPLPPLWPGAPRPRWRRMQIHWTEPRLAIAPDASAAASASAAQWAASAATFSELQTSLRQSVQLLVKDQLAEQRRFMLATFEAFARRLSSEIKEGIGKLAVPQVIEPLPEPRRMQWWPVLLTALLAVVPAAVLGFLLWQAIENNRHVMSELSELRTTLEANVAAAPASVEQPALAAGTTASADRLGPPAGPLAIEYVPYGETPLANARLERLRGLVATLESQRFQGRIVVETYVGDFCLTGSAGEGFAVADVGLPAQNCDLVGNPFDDSLSMAQRQSVDFANFVATVRQRTGGAIIIETVSAGRRNPVEFPEQAEGSTAGAWNTVAAQNNRVEFRLAP